MTESSSASSRRLYSYEELSEILPASNQPHELWDGELIMAPSPFFPHQQIVANFFRKLDQWVTPQDFGVVLFAPIDMVLSPHRSLQPDIVFVAEDNRTILQDVIRGPADLVAEVISPGGRTRDRVEKKDLYEQHGVKEYWILDPEARSVDVLHLGSNRQYTLTARANTGEQASSTLLPGFVIAVDEMFGKRS